MSNWRVVQFDEDTLRGLVCDGETTQHFHSTSFGAATHRWPRVGEFVKVAFNASGELLSVHGDELVPEPDDAFRVRIINKYGMWGAFCTVVLESSGDALDDCGKHVGLRRAAAETSS